MIKAYNKTNFHKHTFCLFTEVKLETIKDLKLNFKSKSGSSYYFTHEGVYRLSNHWGRAAHCKWRLIENSKTGTVSAVEVPNSNRTKLGFANWTDFYPDNDYEKLYFITADFENKTVHYFHKQNEKEATKKILRTAAETTKRIKQIRTLFQENAWAKHLKEENITVIRKDIITQLIDTNKTLQQIRMEYL